jgi:hypothetical protein
MSIWPRQKKDQKRRSGGGGGGEYKVTTLDALKDLEVARN